MARSIPLAFEISTVRESDSSHGAKSSISPVQVREEGEQAKSVHLVEQTHRWANVSHLQARENECRRWAVFVTNLWEVVERSAAQKKELRRRKRKTSSR